MKEYFFGIIQAQYQDTFRSKNYQQFELGNQTPISYGAIMERAKYHSRMISFNRNPDTIAQFDDAFIP